MHKDNIIIDLLTAASIEFPDSKYKIIDNWPADLGSIGISNSNSENQLIYISTYDLARDNYYYECEVPCDREPFFKVISKGYVQSMNELLSIIKGHVIDVK